MLDLLKVINTLYTCELSCGYVRVCFADHCENYTGDIKGLILRKCSLKNLRAKSHNVYTLISNDSKVLCRLI